MSPQQEAPDFRNAGWAQYAFVTHHGAGFPRIHLPPTRVQINVNDWPSDAISDINDGRAELQSHGHLGVGFVLTGPESLIALLDARLTNTDTTYRQFLLSNNLVSAVQTSEVEEVILSVTHDLTNLNARGLFITGTNAIIRRGQFSDEVNEKAWKLLEDYMAPNLYFAFMEKSTVELENNTNTFRLLINKDGKFTILEGERGAGIVASSGRIRSYEYPLGDEIAVFIDWFRHKTKELIAQWNCGTYGIVKEGQRR